MYNNPMALIGLQSDLSQFQLPCESTHECDQTSPLHGNHLLQTSEHGSTEIVVKMESGYFYEEPMELS